MALDLFSGEIHLGSVVRSQGGNVFAYCPAGQSIGQFADFDAAVSALAARAAQEPKDAA